MTFGRLSDNDVVLGDVGASRTLAVIERIGDGFVLRDLNSTNGTFVNRNNLGREDHHLKDGDDICMAPSQVKFAFRYSTQSGSNGRRGGRTVRTRVLDLEERRSTALRSSSP